MRRDLSYALSLLLLFSQAPSARANLVAQQQTPAPPQPARTQPSSTPSPTPAQEADEDVSSSRTSSPAASSAWRPSGSTSR